MQRALQPIEIMAAGELALLCGNYTLGWRMYEARLAPPMQPRTPIYWGDLTDLKNKVVVVRSELGAGDNMLMMRYLPPLFRYSRCAHLVLEAPSGMESLYQVYFPGHDILPFGLSSPAGAIDIPIMSLPLLLSSVLGWKPIEPLKPPVVVLERSGVGIVPACVVNPGGREWRGNKRFQKNPPPATLAELESEFGPFVSLRHDDLNHCSWHDTALKMASLVLIITVDSGPAHLAASLGVPTWVLQRHQSQNACWRWGSPDPWYPGVARVFQQTKPSDWSGPIQAVREALHAEFPSSSFGARSRAAAEGTEQASKSMVIRH